MANIDRRDFLKLVGAGGVGVGAGFALRESIKHPTEHLIPHVVAPEDFSTGIATWYNSVCSMCAAGCGISVRTREGRAKKIEGNPAHPVSQGRLCALGQSGLQVLYNPDRLTGPLVQTGARGSMSFVRSTWQEGLGRVADQLDLLMAAGRGNSVALLTEGTGGSLAQLFESFMAQLGSQRLLHYDFDHPHALYAANQRLFGEEQLPYYDIHNARYLLSFGADFLGNWISPVHHSLGFGHSRQGTDVRGRFVQIEPRMSISGAAADEWIPASPGTEGMMALSIAHQIVAAGVYTGEDRDVWIAALADYAPEQIAEQTGVDVNTIKRLAEDFAGTGRSLAIGGGAAGSHTNGVDTVVAVNALNYLVGNVGKPGGLVFNPTSARPTSHARQATYQQMVDLAKDAREGNIEVLIVSGANPVFTLPAAAEFEQALAEIPLIVSLSSFMDETTAFADVVLPSHTYLESWGDHFPAPGVGFPVGAVSQPVVSPLYDTKATGDIILGLANTLQMGEAIPWRTMEDCVKDTWRNIYGGETPEAPSPGFDEFWTSLVQSGAWGERVRNDTAVTVDRSVIETIGVEPPQFGAASDEFPFALHPYLSSALHDGRGANLPWMQELPDPLTSVVYGSWIEMNPATATDLGLSEGDIVEVESPQGTIEAPVYVYPAIRPDVVAMPIGQGHSEYGRYAQNRGVNPIEILSPQQDTQTGALATSSTRVRITATGDHVDLIKTGGTSRDLGREIIQTTGGNRTAKTNNIPITVLPT